MLYSFDHQRFETRPQISPDDLTDEQLMENIQRGDESALALLHRRHHALLRTIFNRIISNEHDVDELVQECLLEVWRRAENYNPEKGKALGWIVTLARRRAIDRVRRKQAYSRAEMEDLLIAKLIATAARQIGMFLVILAVVSAAIVAFIIYTMTLGKIREIAVLKLIGTHDRTIASMILQQALGLGVIGFVVGKLSASGWAPLFPKYVLLQTGDAVLGFFFVMLVCALASTLAIRVALKVDPAEAIGG